CCIGDSARPSPATSHLPGPTQQDFALVTLLDPLEDPSAEGNIIPKKLKRNSTKWKKNVFKQKVNKGEEHDTKSGNKIPSKTVGEPCTCKKKCFDRVGLPQINQIFSEFYHLADKNLQDAHLFGGIKRMDVTRRRAKTGERGQYRTATYKYTVSTGQSVIEVCAQAFRSIHGIGTTRFKRLRDKNQTTAPKDKRGRHGKQRKIAENIVKSVKEHIKSFPRRESHYSRKDNLNRVYLHEHLNIKRMWLLYLREFEPAELNKYQSGQKKEMKCQVKYSFYKHIFLTEYNLGFGQPRTDTCSQCDRLQNKIENATNEAEKKKLEDEKRCHVTKADNAYNLLKNLQKSAAEDEKTAMYTFDFQQNLPSPTLHSNDMFYCRMLWTYNFALHDCKTQDGIMHLWDETIAKRGSSEVCSCLQYTLNARKNNEENLILFSDGCCGQNRNKAMVSFLLSLIQNKVYKRIDHYFLIRGHTFLPNDRDFSSIEGRKKVARALVPKDWTKIIKDSRLVHPFEVVEITQDNIFDYKTYAESKMKSSFSDTDGQKLKFRDVMWFSYGESEVFNETFTGTKLESHPQEVWCRYTHNTGEPWKKINVFKRQKGRRSPNDVNGTNLKKKYTAPQKLKAAKKSKNQLLLLINIRQDLIRRKDF
ncbi:MAG: hypothetical protein AAF652_11440, partial [Cyanobacteria bacterium P01_C01_bin.72]